MKNFFFFTLLLLSLLSAGSLFAQNTHKIDLISDGGVGGDGGGPKQSWSDIIKDPNLSPNFPRYDVEGRMISYNNLCLLGERIRTKYKHVVSNHREFKLIFDYLVTDRVRTETVCARESMHECVDWQTIIFEIPVHEEIEVLKKKESPAGYYWEVSFKKDFELQECLDF